MTLKRVTNKRALRRSAQIFASWLAALLVLNAQAATGVNEADHKLGMSKAPAVAQAAGIRCTMTDARVVPAPVSTKTSAVASATNGGGHDTLDGKSAGGSATQSFTLELDYGMGPPPASATQYEIVCREGLGYILTALPGKKPVAYLCIEVPAPPAAEGALLSESTSAAPTPCVLEGNSVAAQLAAVNAMLSRAALTCTATHVRGIGHNTQAVYIEAACSNGAGYVLKASNPLQPSGPAPQGTNCLAQDAGSAIRCQYTDASAQLAAADALLRSAHPECEISARRYVGSTASGAVFFEFKCKNEAGYLLKRGPNGELAGVVSCLDPAAVKLGGCTLGLGPAS